MVRLDGTCTRCQSRFGTGSGCDECGVGRFRVSRVIRRSRRAAGKRGMNSGKVSNHGKK